MTSSSLTKPSVERDSAKHTKSKITVFHCFNALPSTSFLESGDYDIRSVVMPCSGMTRELFLLKAFEAGADAAIVLACPEGTCRYLQGNIRAKKRVARVKKLLDEIGIDGKRLNLFNIPHGDQSTVEGIVKKTVSDLASLGPNPAGRSAGSYHRGRKPA